MSGRPAECMLLLHDSTVVQVDVGCRNTIISTFVLDSDMVGSALCGGELKRVNVVLVNGCDEDGCAAAEDKPSA